MISRVKTDSSFYKFAYIEDEYNYIYKVLYVKAVIGIMKY